jgi:predicted phosphodiesterase
MLVATLLFASAVFHDGPDPVMAWDFAPRNLVDGRLRSRIGPPARVIGSPAPADTALGKALRLDGKEDRFVVADDFAALRGQLPDEKLTIEVWASVDMPIGYGGFFSCLQDNGPYEKGIVLGYDDRTFTFGLSSQGADDGNGKMTYLRAKTQYELGRVYHVVGVYDGARMRIYVNGKLEGESEEQKGPILYPVKAPLALGAYQDDDETNPHHGRLVEVAVYDLVATAAGVEHLFSHKRELVLAAPQIEENPDHVWIVQPYLQLPKPNEITVMWETSRTSTSVVHYGLSRTSTRRVEGDKGKMHMVTLKGLRPETHYVYRVESVDDQGRKLESELFTFRTAPEGPAAIRFTIVGDTQDQPHVNKRIAEHMWNERPDFFMIVGDLVGTGANKTHWVEHFFGSMRPLLSRVPLIPVIGNHEGDARLYYDYMSVPQPEYWYRFTYGDAEFFVVDSNRDVSPGSEQFAWLEKSLSESTARWKFVAHHHPPFSSDEDDYGNLWQGQSTRGDLRLRAFTGLYEKYGVDVVWTGHIHSYERTWPIQKGRAADEGPIYIVCGGGGGGLETHGPTRPEFSNRIRHGHHYCVVSIHNDVFEMAAFDIEGRQFDQLRIVKKR